MNFDSNTVADKLKIIRLGKANSIPFKYDGVEYIGRPLDWVEGMQVNAETKAAMHVEKLDFDDADQFCYRMLATLNKGILVQKTQGDIPSWLEKSQDPETGIEFLRSFYTAYMEHVYPKVGEKTKKETGEDGKK
jgi:hypothetical protein